MVKGGSSLPCDAQAIDEAGISSHESLVQVEKHEPSFARVHGTQHPKQLVDEVRRVSRLLPRAAPDIKRNAITYGYTAAAVSLSEHQPKEQGHLCFTYILVPVPGTYYGIITKS